MPIFELMHYQTEGHLTVVQGSLEDETVKLSQKQLAELSQGESDYQMKRIVSLNMAGTSKKRRGESPYMFLRYCPPTS